MKSNPFYFEIKDVMTQFVAAFNDIIINRHDKDKNVRSRAHVRYVYSPKQRVVHDLTNKARHITLPVVAVNISGISRDNDRVFNKIDGMYLKYGEPHESPNSDHILQPVPVNIDVSMSILARYQTDIEQIISNFVPYSDPYIVISWKVPEKVSKVEQEIRSEVLWSGDLSLTYPDNLTGSEPYRLSCDTSFTIKTWLFKKHTNPVGNIYKIDVDLFPVKALSGVSAMLEIPESEITSASFVISSHPMIRAVDEAYNTVLGYNFNETTSVYLSGTKLNALSGTMYHPTSADPSPYFNAFPAITGVKIPFDVVSDNMLTYVLPDVSVGEEVDIIIESIAGYGTAINSEDNTGGIQL